MKPTSSDYFWQAFNARPMGMFVPPNWIGLATFGMLGLVNPGFWLIGLGAEMGYLYTLISNHRFRRIVRGEKLLEAQQQWQQKVDRIVKSLAHDDRDRFAALQERCRLVIDAQVLDRDSSLVDAQSDGLGKLTWMYLRLLLTRHRLLRVLDESETGELVHGSIDDRIKELRTRIEKPDLREDVKKSLTGQVDILEQRKQKQDEARRKLEFLDAELSRIEEQVELIREQGIVAGDADVVSQRIDQITASLGGTAQWIQEQQQIYGQVEDLLVEPPPMLASAQTE